ncbi:hypothetical protein AB0P21_34000 [Kribbella sp. NPDC056861]|uniref:hypothetical protein n=1 Tax=Kribbella sp. NPDC056861 TaxID=3154857 RepID=UPI003420C6DF
MSASLRRLAVLIAVLAFLPLAPAQAAPPELPDQIAAAWAKDPLYVDPAMLPAFPQSELDRIKAASSAAGFPVFIALLPRTPYLRQENLDLPTLLQARIGKPGLYLVWTVWDEYWSGTDEFVRPGGLKGRSLVSVQLDDTLDNKIVKDRPAPRIVRTIQQAGTAYDGRPLPEIAASDLEVETPRRTGLSTTDKEDRSVFVGMGIGALLGFVLVLTLVLRRRNRPAPVKRGQVTPVSSIRTQADRWIPKAGRALRALEKQKNPTTLQLDLRDDANARLEAARTLRASDNDDTLALAGAFVLARQAFQVASSNDLLPPCFFDPTHPSGTVRAAWSDDTEVPACRTCAKTVAGGKTPRGLLVRKKSGLLGREMVAYWTLDPEDSPMVATGFGALSDDLAERVTRVYGGVR